MRRAVCALLRDGIERSRKLLVGQSQSKRFRKNIAIIALVGERSPLDLAGGMAHFSLH